MTSQTLVNYLVLKVRHRGLVHEKTTMVKALIQGNKAKATPKPLVTTPPLNRETTSRGPHHVL